METLSLDMDGLLAYQKNRPPYLMMDFAEEITPGESARGYKDLPADTWFFKCHFPGDPNMPGMLQTEAMVQMAALTVLTLPGNKGKIVYLTNVKNISFRRKIIPGDRLCLDTKLLSWRRGLGKCSAVGTVDGEIACKAEFGIVMPDVLESFQPKPK
ncbi:MAG: beta-hydroxyacyl-ACP dehydratase [Kordiimonadaceae bacterium]|nr:beta-hydroxyacyl-ACP dehydratase [Kordiimonadaceae bacterium]